MNKETLRAIWNRGGSIGSRLESDLMGETSRALWVEKQLMEAVGEMAQHTPETAEKDEHKKALNVARVKRWRQNNPERAREACRRYYHKSDKPRLAAQQRKEKNRDRVREQNRLHQRKRRNSPQYRYEIRLQTDLTFAATEQQRAAFWAMFNRPMPNYWDNWSL